MSWPKGKVSPFRVSAEQLEVFMGKTYGRWTVVSYSGHRAGFHWFSCECSCEKRTIKQVRKNSLENGDSGSCGCAHNEEVAKRLTKHSLSKSKEYGIWKAMIQRCCDSTSSGYPGYGGRGITVCARWLESPQNFIDDMGARPRGLTLDRVDNDKGYSLENCRWATCTEQNNNTRATMRLTLHGITKPVAQWARELGIPYGRIKSRIHTCGWSAEDALTLPFHARARVRAAGDGK